VRILNNYGNTGIGDFGTQLITHWKDLDDSLTWEVTNDQGEKFMSQILRIITDKNAIITNVGLTGWGKSGVRNFLGFLGIAIHQVVGRKTIVLAHHAIETFAPEETGYTITTLTKFGAHLALKLLKHCDLVVFNPALEQVLQIEYQITPSLVVPLPSKPCVALPSWESVPPVVAMLGYWAPYKGIDIFLEAAKALREEARWVLAGKPHRVLFKTPEFKQKVSRWETMAREVGVELPGYVTEQRLSTLFGGRAVGVLPYTSMSGSSASFATFAERGVPVVASDMPEFRFLADLGAGLVLVPPEAKKLEEEVHALLSNRNRWEELAWKQLQFSQTYSWAQFVRQLETIAREP
jgi:glycosyltransferase involved in cell wall biosynthesis